MTLAEAIRKGATMVPQSCGILGFFGFTGDEVVSACALGGAVIAQAGRPSSQEDGLVLLTSAKDHRWWPEAFREATFCPAQPLCEQWQEGWLNYGLSTVWWNVIHLNDVHRWTPAQIADWVESRDDGGITR